MLGVLLAAGNWALRFERHRRLPRSVETWVWQGLAAVAAVAVLGGIAYVAADHNRVWHAFADVKQDRQYDPARLVSTNSGNRWVWWKEAAGAFSDKPVGGWGAGSFGTVHLRYRENSLGVQQPHNVELQWLSETGDRRVRARARRPGAAVRRCGHAPEATRARAASASSRSRCSPPPRRGSSMASWTGTGTSRP